jgi:ribosomal protein S18 acetylase RimI-like enzyme
MITQATIPDISAMSKLVNESYRGPVARQGWTHEADVINGDRRTDEEELKQLINRPGCVFLLFKEDDKLVGSVFLEKTGADIYLGMLSVHPLHQDKGIGRKLVNASEKYAIEHGCDDGDIGKKGTDRMVSAVRIPTHR